MPKKETKISMNKELKEKTENISKNIESSMCYKAILSGDTMSFDWIDKIEAACPYIDNIIRSPRLTLIKEENVIKIERVKKVSVESVKDLCKHTQYIEKIDPKTKDMKPSKILEIFNEDSFGTYENRFIYTLINHLTRFVSKQEKLLEDFELNNNKTLEYTASANTNEEKINIELKVNSEILPKDGANNNIEKELESIRERVKRIRLFITSWEKSAFIKSLIATRALFVYPPIRKTNLILKNTNFQEASKLWDFIYSYIDGDDSDLNDELNTEGDNVLRGILDHSFLMDYIVLDSISKSKRVQKDMLSKYALIMVDEQIKKIVSLLYSCGVKISDEQILEMIASAINEEKKARLASSNDVKNKFKDAMTEYLEKTKNYI